MEWHPLTQLFPMMEGQEYEDHKASIEASKGNKIPIQYRMIGLKKQWIDGRNRARACFELDLTPKEIEVKLTDDEVKQHIIDVNFNRRNLTPAVRAELRKELVTELRVSGKSLRAIADDLNCSKDTVRADLQSQVSNGQTPGIPKTVTGLDGKSYATTKLCRNCRLSNSGPKKNCKDCRAVNQKPREPGDDTEAESAAKKNGRAAASSNGKALPSVKEIRDKYFGPAIRWIDDFGNLHGTKKCAEANAAREALDKAYTAMKEFSKIREKVMA